MAHHRYFLLENDPVFCSFSRLHGQILSSVSVYNFTFLCTCILKKATINIFKDFGLFKMHCISVTSAKDLSYDHAVFFKKLRTKCILEYILNIGKL